MTDQDRSMLGTPLYDLLGSDLPILLAWIGGVTRCEPAAGAAGSGGRATLGMEREAPDLIESEVCALRGVTHRPFAVNLIPAVAEALAPTRLPVVVACGPNTERIGRMTSKEVSLLVRFRPQDASDGEGP